MSEHTQETTSNRPGRNRPAPMPEAMPEAPANGQDTAPEAPARNVTLTIADMEVTLPVRFAPGMALTENQAKVLDAAYQRQFTNNQNAMAKSRAESLGKATDDAGRAKYAALSANAIAALYADYEPNVGGTPRQSAMDKIRSDAAWRFWTANVKAHNDNLMAHTANGAVSADYVPVIAKAGKSVVKLPQTTTGADGVKVTAEEKRNALVAGLLSLPVYADRIQVHIDAIMAERGSKKDTPAGADTISLGADDLF